MPPEATSNIGYMICYVNILSLALTVMMQKARYFKPSFINIVETNFRSSSLKKNYGFCEIFQTTYYEINKNENSVTSSKLR